MKEVVEDLEEDVKATEQLLMFEGKELRDSVILSEQNVVDGSDLFLEEKEVEEVKAEAPLVQASVNVCFTNGEKVNIPVNLKEDTVLSLKSKIEELHGIPVELQKMTLCEQHDGEDSVRPKTDLDNNDITLAEAEVEDGATLQVTKVKTYTGYVNFFFIMVFCD